MYDKLSIGLYMQLGEENYQRQKLKNDIATLPSALSADIDE